MKYLSIITVVKTFWVNYTIHTQTKTHHLLLDLAPFSNLPSDAGDGLEIWTCSLHSTRTDV